MEVIVADDWVEAAADAFVRASPRKVALAGGSTPRPLYERLARADLPWRDMDVLWTDERCVGPDDPDSNQRMVRESLLDRLPPPGARPHPFPGESCDPEEADRMVKEVLGGGPLDLAVLGLGEDGHTASLFPGDAAALGERGRAVLAVERPDHRRLTLTLPVLSSAGAAMFVVSGGSKRHALAALLAGEGIPAARVRAGRVMVITDPEAAGAQSADPPL